MWVLIPRELIKLLAVMAVRVVTGYYSYTMDKCRYSGRRDAYRSFWYQTVIGRVRATRCVSFRSQYLPSRRRVARCPRRIDALRAPALKFRTPLRDYEEQTLQNRS